MSEKMKLVPATADYDMKCAGSDENTDADREGIIYSAMLSAAPNEGKVSRERFISACKAASEASGPISTARAVIAALGLEIEE